MSTSSCLATVAVQADELQFGAPAVAATADSFGVIDDTSESDAIEPRVAGPAVVIREKDDSSRSHLQFREQNGPWQSNASPIGSAIQLLPPQIAQPAPMEQPVFLGNADAKATEEIVRTPRMVTREDARLNGVRKTWEPKGPLFTQTEPSMILRGPESAEAELADPNRQQLADNVPDSLAPSKMPAEFDSRPTRSVSDRNGSATWEDQANPKPNATRWNARRNVTERSPLRDPQPSTTMAPIGSGALPQQATPKTQAPTTQTPTLPPMSVESLPSLPALNAPADQGTELNAAASDLPKKVDELTSKIEELTAQLNALKSSKPAPMEPKAKAEAEPEAEESISLVPPSIPKTRSAIDSLPEMKPSRPSTRHEELPSLEDAEPAKKDDTVGSGLQSNELSLGKTPSMELQRDTEEEKKRELERRLNESIAEQLRQEEARDRSEIEERENPMSLDSASPSRPSERHAKIKSDKRADELSRVPLQAVERDRLTPLEDAPAGSVSLRDIHGNDLDEADLQEFYAEEAETQNADSGSTDQQRLRLAELDATGRPKTHRGKGAAANLSTGVMRMQQPIVQCLQHYYTRRERADGRSNWGMMHAVMVFGPDTRLIARGRDYSTIAWMAGNNVCRGQRLMEIEGGKIKAREGVGLQGHQAQWLAVLAMAGVPSDYPLYVDGQKFSVADLVKVEAFKCKEGEELTFSLIGLSHYLDTETTWVGADGERWDFSRLIAAELDQPVVGSACGGTHRLMGFAHALRKRRLEGQPIDGQWARAEQFLDDFVDYTLRLQNRDGSMSTDWFESRQDNGDLDRKVQTTGHMVEFLLTHLPDEKLLEPEVLRSVTFLLNAMLKGRNNDWSIGPKGHALRSLALFHQRVYGEPAPLAKQRSVARQRQTTRRSR
ncbi:MAG: GTPase-activating protein [Rhodopirellula sp. JB055]|uniref:GTPase-activating protein n=1 Tax=Rhodopirellula sp. JB055 TaxID=3342846 RepID=UPI00370AA2E5